MNRRQLLKLLGSGALMMGAPPLAFSSAATPQVAITIDDFGLGDLSEEAALQRSGALLKALREAGNLQAAAFICGARVDNPIGKKVLRGWNDARHLLANHTYSHWYYPNKSPEEFAADILRAEALLKDYSQFKKYFRFPYLKEGDTRERRDKLRAFLKEQGYRMGYVTIDASDWYVDQRLRARLTKAPNARLAPYRDYYLRHIWERASYYNDLSQRVLGRSARHTLLIHFNLLNELFLADLLAMFKRRGWQLINAETAFADPVFAAEPPIIPAGESIIWALAKASGRFEKQLRYPAEDGEYEKAKMDKLGL